MDLFILYLFFILGICAVSALVVIAIRLGDMSKQKEKSREIRKHQLQQMRELVAAIQRMNSTNKDCPLPSNHEPPGEEPEGDLLLGDTHTQNPDSPDGRPPC